MKDAYKQKVYNLIEGVLSRSKILDDGITGVKKVSPQDARRLVSEVTKLTQNIRERTVHANARAHTRMRAYILNTQRVIFFSE